MTAFLENLTSSAIGPFDPLAKAAGVSDGFSGQLALAHSLRNLAPPQARERLEWAFAAWPIMCRVMAELEAAFPEEAGRGEAQGRQLCDRADRRDGKGDYA